MTKPVPWPTTERKGESARSLRQLLHGSVLGPQEQYLGYVFDVAVRLRHGHYPRVAGLLAGIGTQEVFLPSAIVRTWHPQAVTLGTVPSLRPFRNRDRLTLLASELLGQPVTDTTTSTKVRAWDFLLRQVPYGWVLTTIDTGGRPSNRLIDWKSAKWAGER